MTYSIQHATIPKTGKETLMFINRGPVLLTQNGKLSCDFGLRYSQLFLRLVCINCGCKLGRRGNLYSATQSTYFCLRPMRKAPSRRHIESNHDAKKKHQPSLMSPEFFTGGNIEVTLIWLRLSQRIWRGLFFISNCPSWPCFYSMEIYLHAMYLLKTWIGNIKCWHRQRKYKKACTCWFSICSDFVCTEHT